MKTGRLFITTALIEFMTGVALMLVPSITAEILLGSPISTIAGTTIGRVAGAAFISLAVACWLARNDEQSNAAKGLVVAMLLYNIIVTVILASTVIVISLTVVLSLVLITHLVLIAWCIYALQKAKRNEI
jgi:hypothetical protein